MNVVYSLCELFDTEVLVTEERVPDACVPIILYKYELRGCDDDPGCPGALERHVFVNFAGTLLSTKPLLTAEETCKDIVGLLNYLGSSEEVSYLCESCHK